MAKQHSTRFVEWVQVFGVARLARAFNVRSSVVRQWVGPGGDSLAFGHNAVWLTNYDKGTIARLRIEDAIGR